MTCLPQLVCMHGLPASDPAHFFEARILLFGHVRYDRYTLSSNKHDFTKPYFDPSLCHLSLSVIVTSCDVHLVFGSSSLFGW